MPKRTSDVRTVKSDAEIASSIDSQLSGLGFKRKASTGENVWKKGLYWTIFASVRTSDGIAHLEVWNHAAYPGMGSYLIYFSNRGKLQDILERMEGAVADGNISEARVVPRTEATGELRYAGFWRRLGALMIDLLLFYVVIAILRAVLTGILSPGALETMANGPSIFVMAWNSLSVAILIGAWLYFAVMESSSSQATLGKKAFGMKVADPRGGRISFGKATGRFLASAISLLTVGIGFLFVLFTKRKQALHDMITETIVIRR
jgi:uncharacterized RDD family membrane protein YckC